MENTNHCSSNASNPSPNAFTAEFLAKLHAREDAPFGATEAENRGPWQVVQLPPGGEDGGRGGGSDSDRDSERWAVLRAWEDPATAEPSGVFVYREHALLWAAALEVGARGSVLAVGVERDDRGQVVSYWCAEEGTRTLGHITIWDDTVAPVFRVLESLLRSPEALARLMDAGGAPIAELLGRRLALE